MCEGIDMFDSVVGSMTWVRGCGFTTPWSALTPIWGSLTLVPRKGGNACKGGD